MASQFVKAETVTFLSWPDTSTTILVHDLPHIDIIMHLYDSLISQAPAQLSVVCERGEPGNEATSLIYIPPYMDMFTLFCCDSWFPRLGAADGD